MKILNNSEIYFTLQKFPKKKSEEWDKPSRKEKDKKKDYSKERQRKRGELWNLLTSECKAVKGSPLYLYQNLQQQI